MKKIRVGIVGLGQRGTSLIKTIISTGDADIVAVCDVYEDRVEKGINKVKEIAGNDACGYTDYSELLKNPEYRAVLDKYR